MQESELFNPPGVTRGLSRRTIPRQPMVKQNRSLSAEEYALWQQVTRQATPLKPQQKLEIIPEESPPAKVALPITEKLPFPVFSPSSKPTQLSPLVSGSYAGIDRATADYFRTGRMKIGAKLDLHGYTREKAFDALTGFLFRAYDAGKRSVLVITGKGAQGSRLGQANAGILKAELPRWLNEPGLRPLILAFDTAPRGLGGDGATLILLKRKRGEQG